MVPQVAFLVSKCTRKRQFHLYFQPGLCTGSRWWSLRRSPRPLSRMGRRRPHPHTPPVDALGALVLGFRDFSLPGIFAHRSESSHWNETSRELSLPGTFVPGSECSPEHSFRGVIYWGADYE